MGSPNIGRLKQEREIERRNYGMAVLIVFVGIPFFLDDYYMY